jgi:hypothetical protein
LQKQDSAAPIWTKSPIWSIRAPSPEKREVLDQFSKAVKEDGLDVCRVTIGFAEAYLAARNESKKATQLKATGQVINIQQNNVFQYQVQKPRREPYSLTCVKAEFVRTISGVVFDGYVENKARRLGGEFTCKDFLELKYDSFRRIVIRLKRKGIIIAHPLRSIPQVYILTEKLSQEQKQIAAKRVQHSKTNVGHSNRKTGDSVFGGGGSG